MTQTGIGGASSARLAASAGGNNRVSRPAETSMLPIDTDSLPGLESRFPAVEWLAAAALPASALILSADNEAPLKDAIARGCDVARCYGLRRPSEHSQGISMPEVNLSLVPISREDSVPVLLEFVDLLCIEVSSSSAPILKLVEITDFLAPGAVIILVDVELTHESESVVEELQSRYPHIDLPGTRVTICQVPDERGGSPIIEALSAQPDVRYRLASYSLLDAYRHIIDDSPRSPAEIGAHLRRVSRERSVERLSYQHGVEGLRHSVEEAYQERARLEQELSTHLSSWEATLTQERQIAVAQATEEIEVLSAKIAITVGRYEQKLAEAAERSQVDELTTPNSADAIVRQELERQLTDAWSQLDEIRTSASWRFSVWIRIAGRAARALRNRIRSLFTR